MPLLMQGKVEHNFLEIFLWEKVPIIYWSQDGPQGVLDMAVKKRIPRASNENWIAQCNMILSIDSNLLYWNLHRTGQI